MTYTLNAPNPNDSPAAQQPALSTNTNLVNTYFGTDHVTFTEAANQGEHVKVTLTDVQSDPTLLPPKTQLYSKTVSGAEQLFFANSTNIYQVTPPTVVGLTILAKCTTNNNGSAVNLLGTSLNFNAPTFTAGTCTYTFAFSTPLTSTQGDNAKVFINARLINANTVFRWNLTTAAITVQILTNTGAVASGPGISTPNGITILVIE